MPAGFAKIFSSILDSSIWEQNSDTRIVWITMLAIADKDGRVEASVGGLARRACVPRETCEAALKVLMGPDLDSRDGTTGERIERVRGGWHIINHSYYRQLRTPGQVATAERVAKHRERKRREDGVTVTDETPGSGSPASDSASASASAEEESEEEGDEPISVPPPPVPRDESLYAALRRTYQVWFAPRNHGLTAPEGVPFAKAMRTIEDWCRANGKDDLYFVQLLGVVAKDKKAREVKYAIGWIAACIADYANQLEDRKTQRKRARADDERVRRDMEGDRMEPAEVSAEVGKVMDAIRNKKTTAPDGAEGE